METNIKAKGPFKNIGINDKTVSLLNDWDLSFSMDSFCDKNLISIDIDCEPEFEIKICYWGKETNSHIQKELCTIKKNSEGKFILEDTANREVRV